MIFPETGWLPDRLTSASGLDDIRLNDFENGGSSYQFTAFLRQPDSCKVYYEARARIEMSFWKLLLSNKGEFLCCGAQDTHTHTCILKKPLTLKAVLWGPLFLSDVTEKWTLPTSFWPQGLGDKWLKCGNHFAICNSKIPLFFDSLHRDGLISKDEMMAYFLRAKSQLHCKMGPGFVHNFQEMTYLKPTFCEHCAGFVSLSSIVFCRT